MMRPEEYSIHTTFIFPKKEMSNTTSTISPLGTTLGEHAQMCVQPGTAFINENLRKHRHTSCEKQRRAPAGCQKETLMQVRSLGVKLFLTECDEAIGELQISRVLWCVVHIVDNFIHPQTENKFVRMLSICAALYKKIHRPESVLSHMCFPAFSAFWLTR